MLRNYLAIAFGNMRRSPSYTFINVSGLALGITCALLIFFLVSFHLSFDTFHHDADRIYRFVTEEHSEAVDYEASVPPSFGKAFRDDYTFAEKVARLSTEDDVLITVGGDAESNKFKMHVSFAEPEFFDIFNFPLISGDPRTILTEPNTAVIDEATSNIFFWQRRSHRTNVYTRQPH